MKRDSLHARLRTEKGLVEPYKNIWFVIPSSPPRERTAGVNLEKLGRANRVIEGIPSLDSLADSDLIALGLVVRSEALASSRMEGTWSTIDQVFTPGELWDANEKSNRASIVSYARALEQTFSQAQKKGPEVFSLDLLRQLHKAIMSRTPDYPSKPGLFRSEEKPPLYVTIGGFPCPENSLYNPAPPRHLAAKLDEWLDWIKDDILSELGRSGQGLSLVERLAIGHASFEAIHPFRDGNGRVGRMLLALQMIAEGISPLYLSAYMELQKEEYVRALEAAQKKLNYGPLTDIFSDAIVVSWDEFQNTKKALAQMQDRWLEHGSFRRDSASLRTLPFLLSNPIFTGPMLSAFLEVSAPATYRAIDQLVERGIVRERASEKAKSRVFAAEEIISLLARRLDEPAPIALERGRALLNTSAPKSPKSRASGVSSPRARAKKRRGRNSK